MLNANVVEFKYHDLNLDQVPTSQTNNGGKSIYKVMKTKQIISQIPLVDYIEATGQ